MYVYMYVCMHVCMYVLFFLDKVTLEDGADRFSRNVGKELPT
jgi:hypothetical protein